MAPFYPIIVARLEVPVDDVSRMEIFHSQSHLMDQGDLLAPHSRRSLEIIDDVSIMHCQSAIPQSALDTQPYCTERSTSMGEDLLHWMRRRRVG
jgi:hypothetical protein